MKAVLTVFVLAAMLSSIGCKGIAGKTRWSTYQDLIDHYDFPVPEKYGANVYWKLHELARAAFLKSEKGYDDDTIDHIIDRVVTTGMTTEQVMYSWGKPEKINEVTRSLRIQEQWVYPGQRYLYFENGKLLSGGF